MPALARCPQCDHRRELHWVEQDRPVFGCFGCPPSAPCALDYEETAALLDGSLGRSSGETLIAAIDAAREEMADPADPLAPVFVPGMQADPGQILGRLDIERTFDHLTLLTALSSTPLGLMGVLVFRFGRSDSPTTAQFGEPFGFLVPNLEALERFEELVQTQIDTLRRSLSREEDG